MEKRLYSCEKVLKINNPDRLIVYFRGIDVFRLKLYHNNKKPVLFLYGLIKNKIVNDVYEYSPHKLVAVVARKIYLIKLISRTIFGKVNIDSNSFVSVKCKNGLIGCLIGD